MLRGKQEAVRNKAASTKPRLEKPRIGDHANKFFVDSAVETMKAMSASVVNLAVSSPLCNNPHCYKGWQFGTEDMLRGLYRAANPGGVVVWAVNDRVSGGKSLTSFEHAFIGRDTVQCIKEREQ